MKKRWTMMKEKRYLESHLNEARFKLMELQAQYDKAMSNATKALQDKDTENAQLYLAIAEHTKAQIEMAATSYESNVEVIDQCEKTSGARSNKWMNVIQILGGLAVSAGLGAATYHLQQNALTKAYENDKSGEMVNKKTLGFFNVLPQPIKGWFNRGV